MRPKAEWAIDSEAMRARGIIVLVKSNQSVKKTIETKHLSLVKARQHTIQPPLFWFSKPALFASSGL